jgi:hypothetical protein
MPIIFLLAMMWVASLSSCASHAMERQDTNRQYTEKLDANPLRDQVKEFICSQVECPEHVHIDELKMNGGQFASVRVSTHYVF